MDDRSHPDQRTWLAFVLIVLFGGANAVAVRQTVLELDPLWAAAFRFGVAGSLLVALALASRQPRPNSVMVRQSAVYGAIGFAASFACINIGLRDVPGGTGSVLVAMAPLMTLGLAIAQRQERFHLQALVGALVAVAGVGIVFLDQLQTAVPLGSLLLVLVGAACISEAGIIARGMPRNDPFWINAIGMLVAFAILLPLSRVAGDDWLLPTRSSTWIALVYLIVFGSVVAFSLVVYALRRLPASIVAYTTLLFPLVGVTVATLLTGERFSPSFVIGGVVMLAGVYIGAFRRRSAPRPATA
jgi:drug/metabolite transporter (DMT)-like permease